MGYGGERSCAPATRQFSALNTQHSAKLSCHSDYVDPDTAKKVQEEKLVQIGVGVKTTDSVI